MVDDLKQKTVRMQKLHKWEEFSTFPVLERKDGPPALAGGGK